MPEKQIEAQAFIRGNQYYILKTHSSRPERNCTKFEEVLSHLNFSKISDLRSVGKD